MDKLLKPRHPWENYSFDVSHIETYAKSINSPSASSKRLYDAYELSSVYHITHLEQAIGIMEKESIKTSIHPNIKIDGKGLEVCWFSPNRWTKGSRYGHVNFHLNFKSLLEGRKCYWMEDVDSYDVKTCRFLLTSNNYDKLFKRYNPGKDKGPLYYNKILKKFYRHPGCCLQFLIEGDVAIGENYGPHFTKHHDKLCSMGYGNCKDINETPAGIETRFIAHILAYDSKININPYRSIRKDGSFYSSDTLRFRIGRICKNCQEIEFKSDGFVVEDQESEMIAKSSLISFSNNSIDSFRKIVSLFKNQAEYKKTLWQIAFKKFQLSNKVQNEMEQS